MESRQNKYQMQKRICPSGPSEARPTEEKTHHYRISSQQECVGVKGGE